MLVRMSWARQGRGGLGLGLGGTGAIVSPTLSLWPGGDAWGGEGGVLVEDVECAQPNLPLCSPINRVVTDTAHVAVQSRCSQHCSATSPLKASNPSCYTRTESLLGVSQISPSCPSYSPSIFPFKLSFAASSDVTQSRFFEMLWFSLSIFTHTGRFLLPVVNR